MKKITSATYDEHVLSQGPQAQIDVYYEPKEPFNKRRIDIVLGRLDPRPQEMMLDIGCGVGTFVFHCAKKGAHCFGLDYSRESLKMAQGLVARFVIAGSTHFVLGEAMRLPFADRSFDKITAVDFIEHIYLDQKDSLLYEMSRVLKDDGLMVVFTPNKIREDIGETYWKIRHFLFKDKVPKDELHYGLISRMDFERLLKKHGLDFRLYYQDTTRPYLARLPFLKHFLSLDLLWIVRKQRAYSKIN
jgi:cyclopropane fatty-acyl-phospholipid synthase-like methyltransferase